uniref:Uncharacterized protein n=1 Tax=Podoviridae sp. ct8Lf7 TaxID=2827723 RepID=A0A8S5S063_9CAUD|nr:MAG TPA: hypothetical protein [Podoviridae sp. ct8Lf7]
MYVIVIVVGTVSQFLNRLRVSVCLYSSWLYHTV